MYFRFNIVDSFVPVNLVQLYFYKAFPKRLKLGICMLNYFVYFIFVACLNFSFSKLIYGGINEACFFNKNIQICVSRVLLLKNVEKASAPEKLKPT